MKITFEHRIRGYLVGDIWMPQTECYKPLSYSVSDQEARWSEPGTLREHVLAATRDGDFQSCEIADGYLETVATIVRNGRRYTRSAIRDLSSFPSIADCIRSDWSGPSFEG